VAAAHGTLVKSMPKIVQPECLMSAPTTQIEVFEAGRVLAHRSHDGAKMNMTPETSKDAADKLVRSINQKTRKQHPIQEAIRIVMTDLWGE
jgi:hypothetical protein